MAIFEGCTIRRATTAAALIAALSATGCEGWLGPADDEGRPTVGEMGEDHSETGTPGEPDEDESEGEAE